MKKTFVNGSAAAIVSHNMKTDEKIAFPLVFLTQREAILLEHKYGWNLLASLKEKVTTDDDEAQVYVLNKALYWLHAKRDKLPEKKLIEYYKYALDSWMPTITMFGVCISQTANVLSQYGDPISFTPVFGILALSMCLVVLFQLVKYRLFAILMRRNLKKCIDIGKVGVI